MRVFGVCHQVKMRWTKNERSDGSWLDAYFVVCPRPLIARVASLQDNIDVIWKGLTSLCIIGILRAG